MADNFSFINGFLWTFLEKGGYIVIQFITLIVLARLVDPSDFGVLGIINIFISFSLILVDSGMGGALVKKKNVTQIDYSTLFVFNLLTALLLYLVLYILSDPIARFYGVPIVADTIKVVGVTILFNALGVTQNVKLLRDLRFKLLATIAIFSYLLSSLTAIALAYTGLGIWALVTLNLLYTIICTICYLFFGRNKVTFRINVTSLKYQFNFGGFLMMSNLLKTIMNNLHSSIIGKYYDINMAGLYSQAYKIQNIPVSMVGGIIDRVTFPILSKIENEVDFIANIKKINRGFCLLVIPVIFTLSLLSKEVVLILLGEKWKDTAPILSILCLVAIFLCLQSLNRNVLKSRGCTMKIFHVELIQTVILVVVLAFTYNEMYKLLYGLLFTAFLSSLVYLKSVSLTVNYTFKQQVKDYSYFMLPGLLSFLILKLGMEYVHLQSIYILFFSILLLSIILNTFFIFILKVVSYKDFVSKYL